MKKLYIVIALALLSGMLWWLFMPAKLVSPVEGQARVCYETIPATQTTYDYANPVCSTHYHYQNNGNWDQRCHRDTNHFDWWWTYPEHKSPSCPTGFTQYESTCRKVKVLGEAEHQHVVACTPICGDMVVDIGEACDDGNTVNGDGCSAVCQTETVYECKSNSDCEDYDKCTMDNCNTTYSCTHTPITTGECAVTPPAEPEKPFSPIIMKDDTLVENTPWSCGDSAIVKTVANFHLYRKGGMAVLRWVPTEADKVNIYYKQVNSPDWQYSAIGLSNNSYAEIYDLGNLDITFAIQQATGCAGGPLSTPIIDGVSNGWVLYR